MALRMTRARLDFLTLVHRYGGRARSHQGRLRSELADTLGYESSKSVTLRRVLTDLERAGLISTTTRDGRLYEVKLEDAAIDVLEERELIPTTPRRYILDPAYIDDQSHIVASVAAAVTNLERYARYHEIPADHLQARREANFAVHADLTPRLPEPDDLSLEIANCRAAITALGDHFLRDREGVGIEEIDHAIDHLQELRLTLTAARFAIEHPFPDL